MRGEGEPPPELDLTPGRDMLGETLAAKQHAATVASQLGLSQGLVYLQGGPTMLYRDSDQPQPFRQRRYFFYMSGVDEPDCHLTYDLQTEALRLYIPPIDPRTVIWNGPTLSEEEARDRYDVDEVRLSSSLQDDIKAWLRAKPTASVYILHQDQAPHLDNRIQQAALRSIRGRFDAKHLQPAMDKARVRKCPHEVKLIRHANEVTAVAHRSVLRSIRDMSNERQIEGTFLDACIAAGARSQAYEPIAASGENASTLHYIKNNDSLDGRQLVCLDAGCEWNCYASDVTRTFPIHGWSEEAKAIYDVVQEMQSSCIERVKPGVRFLDLHILAHKIAIAGLLRLRVLHGGTVEDIYKAGTSLFFYPHGLGHHLGLECHDVYTGELLGRRGVEECPVLPMQIARPAADKNPQVLDEGMVITVEPGIYFSRYAFKKVYAPSPIHSKYINEDVLERYWAVGGVRIEDDILVTRDGHENLTTAPKGDEMLRIIAGDCGL
ncbi:MAG: hypothetical protein M1832_004208 [Thelocarpon impressellum]|nr:MAG: hypothetical protein M1832_004208 [Thelocarpon impressellum]